MNLVERFTENIKQEGLFSKKDRLLLAVSGGMDSAVLCELCRQTGHQFSILHCNFQLRKEESERDEDFVRALAVKYGVEVLVKRFDTAKLSQKMKKGIQETARLLRYEWFLEVWQEMTTAKHPARCYILTAHHLNDNIETVLMNFFKGTGIAGLRGIQPLQQQLARPLLFAKKEELLVFANENNLDWVEDSSNSSDKYSRNYFRNQLLPLAQTIYPEAENNIASNIARFRDIEVLYQQAIAVHKKKLVEQKGNELHIPVLKLKKTVPLHSIIFEITKEYGFSPQQITDVIGLLESESGRYVQSATHRVIRNRSWLIIASNSLEEAQNILLEKQEEQVVFPGGTLQLSVKQVVATSIQSPANIALLNPKEISFPLLLRKWKAGDYFYPLGMKKKKKVARFLIDQKLSKTEKENTWVIEMNKKVIWIVGHRIDDRFKITTLNQPILEIRVSQKEQGS